MKIKEAREMIEFLNSKTYSIHFRWISKDHHGIIDHGIKTITINLPLILADIAVQIYLQRALPGLDPNIIIRRADDKLNEMRDIEIKIIGQLVLQKLFNIKKISRHKISKNSEKNIGEIINLIKCSKIKHEWLGKRGLWGENKEGEFGISLSWIIVDVFTHEWLHWKYDELKEPDIISKTKRKMERLTVPEIKLLAKYILEIAK